MIKEFIHYEQALELKELGFKKDNDFGLLYKGDDIPSILYQQGFRWFREKYGYYHILNYNAEFNVWILTIADCTPKQLFIEKYNTYEDAEIAAIKKLIEIAKNNL